MTPNELAYELGVDPKVLRAWLRREHPRAPDDFGRRYGDLPKPVVAAARAHFTGAKKQQPVVALRSGNKGGARQSSDEGYVIDLCDEVLGEVALRQYRFEWLLGDPGPRGQVRLPVDAYYPDHGLVIEYRERQHDEPVPFMDKKETISGVKRGEQRREYDQRREQLIPEHGLRLVVIRPRDLRADTRGRLRRDDRQADMDAIRALFTPRLSSP